MTAEQKQRNRNYDKALLIDTGVGIGSLKKFVTDLTDKEISVLITHGHVDHAMGAGEFDRVYMSIKANKRHIGAEILRRIQE